MITLAPRQSSCKDKMDVYVRNVVGNGVEVKLSVQGLDVWKRKTNVYVGDLLVMEAKFVNLVSAYIPYLKDNEWKVRVAKGMDASIVCLSSPVDPRVDVPVVDFSSTGAGNHRGTCCEPIRFVLF